MPHAQSRVAPLFDVQSRSAETINQKIPQPLFRAWKIICRIHWPQNVIHGNLPVERCHQPGESFRADDGINLVLLHLFMVARHLADRPILPVPGVILLSEKRARSHPIHIEHAS